MSIYEKNCLYCGKLFRKNPSSTVKYWNETTKYCSKDCTYKSMIKSICKYGHELTQENSYINKNGNKTCRICRKASSKTESYRNTVLKRIYNITLVDYNKMFEEQKGCCEICKRHQIELNHILNIDHCHLTGEIRALLCVNCNSILGFAKDNVNILNSAIKYINTYNKPKVKE